jgi:hypothetical protein
VQFQHLGRAGWFLGGREGLGGEGKDAAVAFVPCVFSEALGVELVVCGLKEFWNLYFGFWNGQRDLFLFRFFVEKVV